MTHEISPIYNKDIYEVTFYYLSYDLTYIPSFTYVGTYLKYFITNFVDSWFNLSSQKVASTIPISKFENFKNQRRISSITNVVKTERGNSKYIPTNTAGIDSYNIHSECCIMLHTQNLIYNFFKSRQVLHKDFERGLKSRFIHPKSKNIQQQHHHHIMGERRKKKSRGTSRVLL